MISRGKPAQNEEEQYTIKTDGLIIIIKTAMFAILCSQLAKERNGGVSVAWAGDASEHRMERKEETGGGGGSVAGLLVLLVFGGGIRWRLVLRESTRGDNMREHIWGFKCNSRATAFHGAR